MQSLETSASDRPRQSRHEPDDHCDNSYGALISKQNSAEQVPVPLQVQGLGSASSSIISRTPTIGTEPHGEIVIRE